jgi:hypothetical protein
MLVVLIQMTPRATHPNGRPPTIHRHIRLVFPALSYNTRVSPLNGQRRKKEPRVFCLLPVCIDKLRKGGRERKRKKRMRRGL